MGLTAHGGDRVPDEIDGGQLLRGPGEAVEGEAVDEIELIGSVGQHGHILLRVFRTVFCFHCTPGGGKVNRFLPPDGPGAGAALTFAASGRIMKQKTARKRRFPAPDERETWEPCVTRQRRSPVWRGNADR